MKPTVAKPMHWRKLLKAGGWWRENGWIISTGFRRDSNGTEMIIWNPDTHRWEWHPLWAATSYEGQPFKTLTAALLKAK